MKLKLSPKDTFKVGDLLTRETDNKPALVVSMREGNYIAEVQEIQLLIDGKTQWFRDVEVIAKYLTTS
jgi:Iap family predicted aminopeptidase|tara:strand:+ start:760 stop:963 length:204 start_codon:yes stop_codon:yes gene_type:complete